MSQKSGKKDKKNPKAKPMEKTAKKAKKEYEEYNLSGEFDILPEKPKAGGLTDPSLYFNRELSWLEFNERVLEEAADKSNYPFERLKFLAISASNLDEFFMVRVSGLGELLEAGVTGADPAGMNPGEQLAKISLRCHEMAYRQYNCLNRSILPLLERENIFFRDFPQITKEQKEFLRIYFENTLYPILTPMAIDQSRPFPLLSNKSLNIIVELTDGGEEKYAVVQCPSVTPRLLELPQSGDNRIAGAKEYMFTEDVIKEYIPRLFQGYKVEKAYCFRITRNSDLDIDEEDAEDLLNEIEKSIKRRKWGEPVRLEIEKNMADNLRGFLEKTLKLSGDDIFEIQGPLDLTLFMAFYGQPGFDRFKNEPLPPVPAIDFIGGNIFDTIKERDVLVHHPYESFDCVVHYVETAARDPRVLAIKQTLYRVSGHSPIVQALIQAAENGKQVTVIVELKARFDEENNIIWAKKLEKSGCHVVYGLVGLKTHCKLSLVVRREEDGIRRYVHLGTGNYNDSTAKIYTDLGFFTCKESFGEDISSLFNVLTGYSINLKWNKIAVAPVSLRETMTRRIETEEENAKRGKPAKIMAKMNSLVDASIIRALYKAAAAGVEIKLVVRGICCLRPGIPEVSQNITVVSIIDRFLEHSRMFYFENGGEPQIFLSSADWMPRNLDKRVEVAFPVENKELMERLLEIFHITFADTEKLRFLQPDGSYTRVDKRGKERLRSQLAFYTLAEKNYRDAVEMPVEEKFRPISGGDTIWETDEADE